MQLCFRREQGSAKAPAPSSMRHQHFLQLVRSVCSTKLASVKLAAKQKKEWRTGPPGARSREQDTEKGSSSVSKASNCARGQCNQKARCNQQMHCVPSNAINKE